METQPEPLAPWIEIEAKTQFRIDPKSLFGFLTKNLEAIWKKEWFKLVGESPNLTAFFFGKPNPAEIAGTLIQNAMTS